MFRKFLVLTICFGLMGCSGQSKLKNEELIGKFAPYTRLTMLDGEWVALQDYKGKTTVMVFWATWCNKSRKALNKINAFAKSLPAGNDGQFFAISVDKSEKLQEVKERLNSTDLSAFVPAFSGNESADEAYQAFGGESLPYIVVINKAGKVVAAGNDDAPIYQAFNVNPDSVPAVILP